MCNSENNTFIVGGSMVKINGIVKSLAGVKLSDYLASENYTSTRIAVEYNGDILPKSRYDEVVIADGDSIEIVCFVGGG